MFYHFPADILLGKTLLFAGCDLEKKTNKHKIDRGNRKLKFIECLIVEVGNAFTHINL